MDILELLNEDKNRVKKNNSITYSDDAPADLLGNSPRDNISLGEKMAIVDFNKQYFITEEELAPYERQGLNWNPYENMPKQLAESQSNWSKAFNSLGQSLISELGLGTIKGFADLTDFLTSSILHLTEDDYQNPVSSTIEEWQEYYRNEVAPIYTDPDLNILNGGMGNAGWWFKGLPNVVSTLTLLIPSKTITGLAGYVGKTTGISSKIGKGVSKARKWATGVNKIKSADDMTALQTAINSPLSIARGNYAAKLTTEALLMRTMENYQEAREVHKQTYDTALDKLVNMNPEDYEAWWEQNKDMFDEQDIKNDRNKVAKAVAKKAADRTFAMDFGNIIFDIIQLHSLKNIGRGIKPIKTADILETHAKSIASAESLATGVAKELPALSKTQQAFNALKNFGKFNAKTLLEQSTEGIEEAINYISNKEGLSYGKAILEGTAEDYRVTKSGWASALTLGIPNVISTYANMSGDLTEYMKNPELLESAFWGVFGGMVFGVGSNVANKVELAMHRKAEQESRKANPITGEQTSLTGNNLTWKELFEVPEEKAAREGITFRHRRLTKLKDDLKLIKDGFNIFGKRDENGQYNQFNTTIEANLAKAKAEANYRYQIAMDAINSGTFDLLTDYFQSDAVKQAMIKIGLTTESEVDAYVQETLNDLNTVKDIHKKQSTFILNQISALNADRSYKETIPLEYAQIIANDNVSNLLEIKAIEEQIKATNVQIAIDENDITDANPNLDPNEIRKELDRTKETIRLGSILDMYGRLSEEGRIIDQLIKEQGPSNWKLQQQKHLIEAQKEALINELKHHVSDNPTTVFANLLAADYYGNMYKKQEDGKFIERPEAFIRTDEEIVKGASELFKDLDTKDVINDEELLNEAKQKFIQLQDRINYVTSRKGLVDFQSNLFGEYITLGQLELQANTLKSQIDTTLDQIQTKIDWLHNSMNEARSKLIDKAVDIVTKFVQANSNTWVDEDVSIVDAIYNLYQQDRDTAREQIRELLRKSKLNISAEDFLDALDIFNFTSKTNQHLYELLNNIIDIAKTRQLQTDVVTVDDENLNDLNSEETISAPQNSLTEDTPADALKLVDEAGNLDFGQFEEQEQPQQERKTVYLKVIFNNKGRVSSITKSNSPNKAQVKGYINSDGTIELDIKSLPKNEQLKYINSNYFTGDIDVLDVNSDWIILNNPVLKQQNKKFVIASPGELQATSFNSYLEPKYQEFIETVGDIDAIEFENNLGDYRALLKEVYDFNDDTISSFIDRYVHEHFTDTSTPVEEIESPFNFTEDVDDFSSSDDSETFEEEVEEDEDEQDNKDDSIPFTGEQDSTSPISANDNIQQGIAQSFNKRITSIQDPNIDFETITQEVKNELLPLAKNVNLDEEELNKEIDKYRTALENAHNQFLSFSNNLDKAGFNLSFAARYEEPSDDEFSSLFTTAVESFMAEYEKIVVMPKVDGKLVVRLEDILKICNNVYATSDISVATAMYQVIKQYLQTNEASNKYIVLDKDKNRQVVINNITKSPTELANQESGNIGSFRVQLRVPVNQQSITETDSDIFDTTPLNVDAKLEKILDTLEKGDKVQLIAEQDEILVLKDDVVLGRMPYPKIEGNAYKQVNEGWVTTLESDGKNTRGLIVNVVKDLFLKDSSDHNTLRELLTKESILFADESISDEVYTLEHLKLVDSFTNHPLIQNLIATHGNDLIFIDEETSEIPYEDLFNHLVKLWNYSTLSTNANDKQINLQIINQNLDLWFDKLYDSYDAISNIKENTETTVSKINEGEIITAINKATSTVEEYNALTFPTETLVDYDNAHVSIVSGDNTIAISGIGLNSITGFNKFSTLLTIFSRNDEPDYINMWGVKLSDTDALGVTTDNKHRSEMFAMRKAVGGYLINEFTQAIKSKNYKLIEDALNNLIATSTNQNNAPLFRGIGKSFTIESVATEGFTGKGIQIRYGDKSNASPRFKIIYQSQYGSFGYKKPGDINLNWLKRDTDVDKYAYTLAVEVYNFLQDKANINISKELINSDATKSDKYNGFMTYENGKFVIDIKDSNGKSYYRKTYNSYNDFLLKGNLVRINLQKLNGRNFKRKGVNQKATQNLYVSLPKRNTSTTQGYTSQLTSNDIITDSSDVTTFQNLKSIIDNTPNNIGFEIFKEIMTEDEVNEFTSITEEFNILNDLLPNKIIYDDKLNDRRKGKFIGNIAVTNPNGLYDTYHRLKGGQRKSTYLAARNVVVGSKFMNMAANRLNKNKRKEAIRKLIHEQLHIKLHEDPTKRLDILTAVDSIYNEYRQQLEKDFEAIPKNTPEYKSLIYLKSLTTHYKGERLLEEFLVESLTNKTLFDYLNSIKVEGITDNKKEETLFTRIARVIAKLFNWVINDDSLYMKQLNVLRDLTNIPSNENNREQEILPDVVEETQKDTDVKPIQTDNTHEALDDAALTSDEDTLEDFMAEWGTEEIDTDSENGLYSTVEELSEANYDFQRVRNIQAFRNSLPLEIRANYDSFLRQGQLEIKCV